MAGHFCWRALLVALYAFLLAPLFIVFPVSFSENNDLRFPPSGFTLDWYGKVFGNAEFIRGAQISLVVAICASLLAVAVAVPASLAVVRSQFKGRTLIEAFFLSPLVVPAIALGMGLLIVMSYLGLVATYLGLILSHLALTVPYVMRTTLGSLRSSDLASEDAASVLGASPLRVFFTVTVPMITPGVVAGAVIAFLISLDEAVIALFIVGAGSPTLPVAMLEHVQYTADPQVAAVSVLLIFVSLVALFVVERTMGITKSIQP
jgi:putative spermidine/putrescine transport system permease protein